jgi:hypothetical protein
LVNNINILYFVFIFGENLWVSVTDISAVREKHVVAVNQVMISGGIVIITLPSSHLQNSEHHDSAQATIVENKNSKKNLILHMIQTYPPQLYA